MSGRDRELSTEQLQALKTEVDTWEDGPRKGFANTALSEYEYSGASLSLLVDDGELKGVASLSMPYKKRNILAGTEDWSSDMMSIYHMATKERGYGKELLHNLAQRAVKDDFTLAWNATDDSLGFYKALGFEPTTEKGFWIKPDDLRSFIASTKSISLTDEELAMLEPNDGVFAVMGNKPLIKSEPIFIGGEN